MYFNTFLKTNYMRKIYASKRKDNYDNNKRYMGAN